MKNYLFLMLVALCLSSCGVNNYVQVATIASSNMVYEDEVFAYADENIIIDYMFNTESGVFTFSVANISDRDITIELDKSVFIYNRQVFDYVSRECDVAIASSTSFASSSMLYSHTSAALMDNDNIPTSLLIPSGCYRVFEGFDINDTIYRQLFFARDPKIDEKPSVIFNAEESPCTFSNVICYTIDDKECRVQNDFYVKEYRNLLVYSDSDFLWVGKNEYYIKYNTNDIPVISLDYGIICDDRTADSSDLDN